MGIILRVFFIRTCLSSKFRFLIFWYSVYWSPVVNGFHINNKSDFLSPISHHHHEQDGLGLQIVNTVLSTCYFDFLFIYCLLDYIWKLNMECDVTVHISNTKDSILFGNHLLFPIYWILPIICESVHYLCESEEYIQLIALKSSAQPIRLICSDVNIQVTKKHG